MELTGAAFSIGDRVITKPSITRLPPRTLVEIAGFEEPDSLRIRDRNGMEIQVYFWQVEPWDGQHTIESLGLWGGVTKDD